MRNVFDQYSQPENRLTHALATALLEDRRLLRRFVRWATGRPVSRTAPIGLVEQSFPGESQPTEDEAEQRGLPDACIYQGDEWALLIESKVAAPLSVGQLLRHLRTAERRGLRRSKVLVLDTELPRGRLPAGVIIKKWSDVYAWLIGESDKSEWARRAADYFVVAENRLVEEEYLKEGTLTTFSGIPFGEKEPYNYFEAKRLLKLMMADLRARKDLVRVLGIDPKGQGRGAITGKDGILVWDFLRLKAAKRVEQFTNFPHLTLAIWRDRLLATVTVPNSVKPAYRANLVAPGFDSFVDLLGSINTNLLRALRGAEGAVPWVEIVQRHYLSQRGKPFHDARLEYDLRTAFPQGRAGARVRLQPQWLRATYDSLAMKRSNLQLMIGASFHYAQCKRTRDRRIVDYVARSWLACRPLIAAMLKA